MNGFLVFYAQVDIVIISLLVSEEALGWYGAADRLFGTLLFIPTVFMMAVFPALSRMHVDASEKITNASRMSFDLLLLSAVPIGLGLITISDSLIALIFGPDFAESGLILKAFGIALILMYQNILIGMFLISTDRQYPWTRVIVIAAIASIPLDLILIPWCQQVFNNGALGGAFAYIITEAFMLIAGIRLLPKGTLGRANLSFATRTLLAGATMVAATWWLRDEFILIPIVVGALVYSLSIISMRLISPEIWRFSKYIMTGVLRKLGLQHMQAARNTTE
ncbi:MAG: oligosaccharide flippase family protein [Candidatus Competibacteraceae bacterium]|nr:oligosaccharide flippase family protein [Candidatus Competibacteraceae bacterium]